MHIQDLAEIHIQDLAAALDIDEPNAIAILDTCRAALAEPVKNCEVGTAEEQAKRYAQYCDAHLRDDGSKPCTNCPCCGKIPFGKCEFAWAQMPYESEVAK